MAAVDSERALFDKIIPADALGSLALPRPLVFTNGVFDILHRGHVTYLAAARQLGAALVIGVNTDASVRRLGKGAGRPVNSQEDRLLVLAALASTTAVTLFAEDTPLDLLAALRPDIYVKGGDYAMDTLAEAALVRSWGGTALALPFVAGHSTSAILHRLGAE